MSFWITLQYNRRVWVISTLVSPKWGQPPIHTHKNQGSRNGVRSRGWWCLEGGGSWVGLADRRSPRAVKDKLNPWGYFERQVLVWPTQWLCLIKPQAGSPGWAEALLVSRLPWWHQDLFKGVLGGEVLPSICHALCACQGKAHTNACVQKSGAITYSFVGEEFDARKVWFKLDSS